MKHKLLCAAAVLALTAMSAPFSEPAFAQAVAPDVLPPHEIVTIVRSAGLNPIDRPVRRGNTYVFRAIGARGQEMRVTVDARYGDVMSVAPVANVAPRLAPGMTLGPYERVDRDRDDDDVGPMTLSPPGIYGSRPPPIGGTIDSDDDTVVYAPGAPPMLPGTVRPPAPVTSAPLAPPPGGQPAYNTQPQQRDQRMQATAPPYSPPPASVAPPPAPMPSPSGPTASVGETQQLGEGGLLPPPPERFPQRVAPPVANPKPAAKPVQQKPAATQPKPAQQQQKTASSGTQPAKPPLPKSKPAAPPGASTSASAPAAAPPPPPPAKKSESDDVPH